MSRIQQGDITQLANLLQHRAGLLPRRSAEVFDGFQKFLGFYVNSHKNLLVGSFHVIFTFVCIIFTGLVGIVCLYLSCLKINIFLKSKVNQNENIAKIKPYKGSIVGSLCITAFMFFLCYRCVVPSKWICPACETYQSGGYAKPNYHCYKCSASHRKVNKFRDGVPFYSLPWQ